MNYSQTTILSQTKIISPPACRDNKIISPPACADASQPRAYLWSQPRTYFCPPQHPTPPDTARRHLWRWLSTTQDESNVGSRFDDWGERSSRSCRGWGWPCLVLHLDQTQYDRNLVQQHTHRSHHPGVLDESDGSAHDADERFQLQLLYVSSPPSSRAYRHLFSTDSHHCPSCLLQTTWRGATARVATPTNRQTSCCLPTPRFTSVRFVAPSQWIAKQMLAHVRTPTLTRGFIWE